MSADEEQSLSAEDLRKRLYQSFKRKGVLDAVKVSVSAVMSTVCSNEGLHHVFKNLLSHSLLQGFIPNHHYNLQTLTVSGFLTNFLYKW